MTAWQTPDGQEAIERMGPVCWEESGNGFRLRWHTHGGTCPGVWSVDILLRGQEDWDCVTCVTDHEVCCLHRDHARHWLNTRDCAEIPVAALGLGATDKDYIDAILAVGKD